MILKNDEKQCITSKTVKDTNKVITGNNERNFNEKRKMRKFIFERDNHTCHYCHEYGNTIDHVLPLSKGGCNDYLNMVCACFTCNQIKDSMTKKEFLYEYPTLEKLNNAKKNFILSFLTSSKIKVYIDNKKMIGEISLEMAKKFVKENKATCLEQKKKQVMPRKNKIFIKDNHIKEAKELILNHIVNSNVDSFLLKYPLGTNFKWITKEQAYKLIKENLAYITNNEKHLIMTVKKEEIIKKIPELKENIKDKKTVYEELYEKKSRAINFLIKTKEPKTIPIYNQNRNVFDIVSIHDLEKLKENNSIVFTKKNKWVLTKSVIELEKKKLIKIERKPSSNLKSNYPLYKKNGELINQIHIKSALLLIEKEVIEYYGNNFMILKTELNEAIKKVPLMRTVANRYLNK